MSTLVSGQTILHYRIQGKIGQGGMGEVYEAEDLKLGRRVAIKLLPSWAAQMPQARQRFLREARSASALNHPNIVTIYAVEETAGLHLIVMEYVEGEPLASLIERGPLDSALLLEVGIQVASALAAAHQIGIVHRDIKPSNILMSAAHRVKVVDFGLAKPILDLNRQPAAEIPTMARELTASGILIGTISYMSPEQTRGGPVDGRSDLFSLGAVLYEAATGELPFKGPSALATLHEIAVKAVKPPTELNPKLTRDFDFIIERLLAKEPEQRFVSASDVVELLTRLKGAARVGSRSIPPAREAERQVPHNLSVQPTPLIGREKERADLRSLLLDVGIRLVTLSGAAGTGKTRLALDAAESVLEHFPDGVFFVSLASIADPALVPATVAQALGIRETVGQDLLARFKEQLGARQMLLFLDNFEHLLPAAGFVADLLAHCPRVKILVTSRAALRLRGERELSIPPLEFPDLESRHTADDLSRYPAVALFEERARAVRPDFALTAVNARAVAEICARVDGLPLAIELAAARVKLLSPEAMLRRIQSRLRLLTGGPRDLPARQKTLRSAIEWSYDLLQEEEKRLFHRLAVFAGGCTLDAAEAVCDPGGRLSIDLLDGIESLVDNHLLRREDPSAPETRLHMLQTIREYALERLESSGESGPVRDRHAQYFVSFADEGAQRLSGSDQAVWLDRLEIEHDNLRAAMDWLLQKNDVEGGLRLGIASWRFWEIRGHLTEGRERLAALLSSPRAPAQGRLQTKAFYAAGVLADAQGDYEAARSWFERELAAARGLDDPRAVATSLNNLGIVALRQKDYQRALEHYEESLGMLRGVGDGVGTAWALYNLGQVALYQGDHDLARRRYEESLAVSREMGDEPAIAWALNNLGDLSRDEGDYEQALSYYEESLVLFDAVSDSWAAARTLADLGDIARELRDYGKARSRYEQGLGILERLGDRQSIARLLEALACLAAAEGKPDRALRLAGASAMLREALGLPLSAPDRARLETDLELARGALDPEAAREAWEAGRRLRLEQAIRYALGEESSGEVFAR